MRTIFLFLLLTPSLVAQDARERFEKLIQPKPPIEQPKPAVDPPVAPEVPEVPEAPKAGVTFSMAVSAPAVVERYLAVGPNCAACPAGKAKFLSSGGKPENIVDYTVSNSQHGQNINRIPQEYNFKPLAAADGIVATAEGIEPSPEAVVVIFAEFIRQNGELKKYKSGGAPYYGGWFDYTVDVPDFVPLLLQKLMKDKSYTNDTFGLTLLWPGQQTFRLNTTSIKIEPAIQASVRKYGVTASASISEVRFTPDYKTVTIVTPEILVPDLTINFK